MTKASSRHIQGCTKQLEIIRRVPDNEDRKVGHQKVLSLVVVALGPLMAKSVGVADRIEALEKRTHAR